MHTEQTKVLLFYPTSVSNFYSSVTFTVSLLIDGYLYAGRRQTVRYQKPDFHPNYLGNMASCFCHDNHKGLQRQHSVEHNRNSSSTLDSIADSQI